MHYISIYIIFTHISSYLTSRKLDLPLLYITNTFNTPTVPIEGYKVNPPSYSTLTTSLSSIQLPPLNISLLTDSLHIHFFSTRLSLRQPHLLWITIPYNKVQNMTTSQIGSQLNSTLYTSTCPSPQY